MRTKTSDSNRGGLSSAVTLIIAVVGVTLYRASAGAVDRQVLGGNVPPTVAKLNLQPVGRLPATNQLRLAIGLPLRHTNELDRLLQEIYDPASPRFRHYLTPEQFAERFGPSTEDYEAVKRFALRNGLEVTATYPNRFVLDVAGAVSKIEYAFRVKLQEYAHPTEHRTFYAPNVEPSVDAGLPVLDISGLDNYTLPHPGVHKFSHDAYSTEPGTGSGPSGNFMGEDLRNAYAPGVTLDGTGQIVGLLAFWGYYPDDVAQYEKMTGLPNVPIQVVLLDGFNGIPTSLGSDEGDLDIDMAICMAPGLSKVVVFDAGPNGTMTDVLAAMVNYPQIKQFSASGFGYAASPYFTATTDNLFKELALQGQSFFLVSGDGDVQTLQGPSLDDPYVTSVGATTLTMNGAGASYASEIVWNWGFVPGSGYLGSSGGISTFYRIPTWQKSLSMAANRGSTTWRNFPDVSMIGDKMVLVWQGSASTGWGGTSVAAPLWAGFTALVNQEAAANGQPSVGFLNPALYALGQSPNYTNCFHDITVGNNITPISGGLFSAVPGYDLCSGWGTPNGSNLIQALALPETLLLAAEVAPLFTGPVGGPFTPASLALTLTNRVGSVSWALGTDSPWLMASPSTGTVAGDGPATNILVAPNGLADNLSCGSYTATLFLTNFSDQSVQQQPITLQISALPIITSGPTDETVLQGMTATFTVATATNAPLAYQWFFDNGSGPATLANGGGISGVTTSTLTISNASSNNAGSYSVIITNVAGTVSSTPASLAVSTGQAPVILDQPTNQTVLPGAAATFSVSAAGDQPLSYAWLLNGTNVAAANVHSSATRTLLIAGAMATNAGNYTVIITNNFGSVTSTFAALNVTIVTASGVTLQTLYSFTNNTFGCLPYGGLVQASDGNFYGAAGAGGANGDGTLYRMKTNGTVSVLYTFTDSSDGGSPTAALIQATNGQLYGTATSGGNNGSGVVFHMATNGASRTAYSLTSSNNGSYPADALLQGRDGNFYGTAEQGGAYGDGTIFKLTPGGVLTDLASLNLEDGSNPFAPLVQAADGNFFGVARRGGTNGGWGTIFEITPIGTLNSVFSFDYTNGANPIAGLTQDPQGNLYGTTYDGGAYSGGTLFELGADGQFISLYSFTGGLDGSNCFAGLLLAIDGNFYGATENGGAYGVGTVFRLSPGGDLTTLVQFDGFQGANPEAAPTQGTDGNLYGTTLNGGTGTFGTIYRISLDGALQITSRPQSQTVFTGDTVVFSVATFGALPTAYQWLRAGANLVDGGNVLGSSSRVLTLTNVSQADATNYSVIVSNSYGAVTSAQATLQVIDSVPQITSQPASQTVLAGATTTLSVEADGAAPLSFQWQENGTNLVDDSSISGSATASLTLSSATPADSGAYSVLVSNAVAAVTSSNAVLVVLPVTLASANLASLYSFKGVQGTSVSSYNPYAGLVQGADSELYGTTLNGGTYFSGTAFKLSLSGGFTLLHSFTNGSVDGANPRAGLVALGAGTFYGAALGAGPDQYGTLFKLTSAGVLTPIYGFADSTDGADPLASLILGSDGNLYGTASAGGTNDAGTIFSLTSNGTFTPLWSFDSNDGSSPSGPLVQGTNGQFYGTTSAGGTNDLGTVFSLSTNGIFNALVSFNDTQGAYPSNGLVQATDGAFYGTASSGGTNGGWGTVFRMTPDGTLTALHSFNYQDGAYPVGGLVQATDGNLYGTTSQGGIGGQGTVFQITTNGLLTTLVWFNGSNGAAPQSSLIQARNGSLYGTAEFGGTGYDGASGSGDGLVFRLTLPMFLSNPFTEPGATATAPYSASLSSNAIAPAGDSLTFGKITGPAWLTVATNGPLSGTPGVSDVGTNVFIASLADANGWSSTATMTITVAPLPSISISLQGTNILLTWSGGQPPYSVQTATSLASPAWQTIAGAMTNTTLLVTPSNSPTFYRVQVQ
jgi:uncharacterized repeat protein (TIGR03803 family)